VTPEPTALPAVRARVAGLDVARGAALAAMVIYHFAWDLSFLGLTAADIRDSAPWIWFARAIAASFLTLAGISLVLAHGAELNRSAFLKRLGLVAGAALLVTVGTYLVFPEAFVFFGILHAIAAGSVLALPFLRAPAWLAALAGLFVLTLPGIARFEALSAPFLVWLGLGTREIVTNDFVPIFPWFGFVLIGVALTKAVDFRRFANAGPVAPPARLLSAAGQHSLIIYLVHQPILFGTLWLIATTLAPQPGNDARGFMSACQSNCRASGGEATICTRACTCVVDMLKTENLWVAARREPIEPAIQSRIDGISQRCVEAAAIPPRP
jgi:uncharacterized membrane protein